MISSASIDNLIHSLEVFKETKTMSQGKLSRVEFDTIFSQELAKASAIEYPEKDYSNQEIIKGANALINQKPSAQEKTEDWLVENQSFSLSHRPSVREFVEVAGVTIRDASEFLYGVVGSNAELRNWEKIMDSDDPVEAVRQATNQLYNSDKSYELFNHPAYGTDEYNGVLHDHSLSSQNVIRRNGNFADVQPIPGVTEKMLVSSSGLILRGAGGDETQIERTAWLFGFSTKDLYSQLVL